MLASLQSKGGYDRTPKENQVFSYIHHECIRKYGFWFEDCLSWGAKLCSASTQNLTCCASDDPLRKESIVQITKCCILKVLGIVHYIWHASDLVTKTKKGQHTSNWYHLEQLYHFLDVKIDCCNYSQYGNIFPATSTGGLCTALYE